MTEMAEEKLNPIRNISELKYDSTSPGWWVRFKLDKHIQKAFYDSQHGGHKNALAIAKRFRDAMERELEPERIAPGIAAGTMTKRNKSGIVGVKRVDGSYQKEGYTCRELKWVSHWPTIGGKRDQASFSIRKLGEREARELAINARLNGLHEFNAHAYQTFRPPAHDLKLWRYMDFTKFVSTLENSGLFFARAIKMDDAFEGGYSRGNEELRELVYKVLGPFQLDPRSVNKRRHDVVLNCWHGSEHESAAMWKLYSSAAESICIQTSFSRLRKCLPLGVEIGRVQYIDYETEWVPERHHTLPFLYKRKSFEHEQEFRAIRDLTNKETAHNIKNKAGENGLWVDCNLDELIQAVYVAPNVPRWFSDLVTQVIERYGLNAPVLASSLELKPHTRHV